MLCCDEQESILPPSFSLPAGFTAMSKAVTPVEVMTFLNE